MLKTPVATAIAALNPHHNHIQDFHVLAHLNRVRAFACGGRRCGKTYAARQQELIRAAFKLSAGATLRLLTISRKPAIMERIVGYDPGYGDQAAECVFLRDPINGTFTLLSAKTVERIESQPWIRYDGWVYPE
ncbi:TPA: hypothetical protein ACXI1U_002472 [Serratia marcescens]|uniref:Terminase n=1 Tax=Serratia ureilytica TaxID=300181 RepID=A0ABU0VLB9_9GAMM|nr:hypothetical protein [Serratia ureilytica]MCU7062491.1 hypothetical protein [Serratia ureilytica]MDQ1809050.1 hypothetical protein [Serratia ureilytica]MDQ1838565.1 hypothetical protein [Serratia ureilytica]MDQ1862234.1 hypothetical protein [Serratia ureilytica]